MPGRAARARESTQLAVAIILVSNHKSYIQVSFGAKIYGGIMCIAIKFRISITRAFAFRRTNGAGDVPTRDKFLAILVVWTVASAPW